MGWGGTLESDSPIHQAVAPLAGFNITLGGSLRRVAVHIRNDLAHVLEVVFVVLVFVLLEKLHNDAP